MQLNARYISISALIGLLRGGLSVDAAEVFDPGQRSARESAPRAVPTSLPVLAEKVKNSVVVISHFDRTGVSDGVGTGFVVSTNGLIATSLHVVGEGRPIKVQSMSGNTWEVLEVYAWDRRSDLALLRVAGSGWVPLPFGDSDQLKQGTELVSMGNPLGWEHSLLRGVVSARRAIDGVDMIQLAMPIEPGNSGGPLLDLEGRVQGIVALKSAVTSNLGFAVPVNMLRALMEKPSPMPLDQWLNIGALNTEVWEPRMGARWRQRIDRILVEGAGSGFGGRSICLSRRPLPALPFEIQAVVRLEDDSGAAGIVFGADGADKHFGFYPTSGQMRLTQFEGPDVLSWKIVRQASTAAYRPKEWNRLRVRIESRKVTCWVNDTLMFEVSDPELAGTRFGLCSFRSTRAEFRNAGIVQTVSQMSELHSRQGILDLGKEFLESKGAGTEGRVLQQLASRPGIAPSVLKEEAHRLERQASQLRELAGKTEAASVEAELKRLLLAGEREIDLIHAALLVARFDDPDLDVESYRAEFNRLSELLAKQVASIPSPVDRLARMKEFFFREMGFRGSRQDYYDKANSYLNQVLEYREGIPITLSILFVELGHRIGLNSLLGHPMPGHFMVAFRPESGAEHVIDVFDGGAELTHAEADARTRGTGEGSDIRSELLDPATKTEVVLRMIRNLLGIARRDEGAAASTKYLDLILAVRPNSAMDRLERARLRAQAGDAVGARADVQWLIDHSPSGFDPDRLEEMLKSLSP